MTKNNAQSERHAGAASPWLFPGESDGHKTKTTLSGQIKDAICKILRNLSKCWREDRRLILMYCGNCGQGPTCSG